MKIGNLSYKVPNNAEDRSAVGQAAFLKCTAIHHQDDRCIGQWCRITKLFANNLLGALFILMSSLVGALSQPVNSGASYDISGRLCFQGFVDGKIGGSLVNTFEVQVRGSIVRMHTYENSSTVSNVIRNFEFISDGKTSYFIMPLNLNPEAIKKSQVPGGHRIFSAFVYAYTNICPPNKSGNMASLWLATSSSKILRDQNPNGGELFPLYVPCPDWEDIGGGELKATWIMSSNPPYLPEQLVQYADRETFQKISSFVKQTRKKDISVVYEKGYTNAIFKVLTWTNSASLQLPQHFQRMGFIPDLNASDADQLQISSIIDGFIDSIKTTNLSSVIMPNQFDEWSEIKEFRYGPVKGQPKNTPIVYTSKSGLMLSKNEVLNLGQGYNLAAQEMDATKEKRRKIIITILGVVSIVPILFLGLRVFLNGKKQQQTIK